MGALPPSARPHYFAETLLAPVEQLNVRKLGKKAAKGAVHTRKKLETSGLWETGKLGFSHISPYYSVVSHTNSVQYWKCCSN